VKRNQKTLKGNIFNISAHLSLNLERNEVVEKLREVAEIFLLSVCLISTTAEFICRTRAHTHARRLLFLLSEDIKREIVLISPASEIGLELRA
jgi:hypothetical protein